MRFSLNITAIPGPQGTVERKLPLNYQYELSSWIYKVINQGDSLFAGWLHQHGFKTDLQKTFKLFTFSNIEVEKKKIEGDRLHIQSDNATLEISFLPVESIDTFIKGLFKEQEFSIGDKTSRVWFRVSSVEALKEPIFKETMTFRAVSPIFMELNVEGRKHPLHLSPEEAQYQALLLNNLNDKYKAFKGTKFGFDISSCTFKVLNNPRRKLIAIKANTSAETKLCAYLYDFEITAPKELMSMGYYCGFGSANSQGFGAVRVMER